VFIKLISGRYTKMHIYKSFVYTKTYNTEITRNRSPTYDDDDDDDDDDVDNHNIVFH